MIFADCGSLSLPEKFSSFSGHEAHNIGKTVSHCPASVILSLVADCSWDFFTCTERYGVWPDNKVTSITLYHGT